MDEGRRKKKNSEVWLKALYIHEVIMQLSNILRSKKKKYMKFTDTNDHCSKSIVSLVVTVY